VDIVANAAGSTVDYSSAYWSVPRQWTVMQSSSRSGAPRLGEVSVDSLGQPSGPFGQWQVTASGNQIVADWSPADPFFTWLYDHFGDDWDHPAIAGTGVDADGDGWSNGEEWVVGTEPDDAASRFTATAEGMGVTFTRLAGRSYEVLTSIHPAGPWTRHMFAPAGTGPVVIPAPANPGPNRFYKIAIRRVP
jgi:hypothetical protein